MEGERGRRVSGGGNSGKAEVGEGEVKGRGQECMRQLGSTRHEMENKLA